MLYRLGAEVALMSEHAVTRMSAEEFLEWGLNQELRYELVDGVPVAMAGAKQRHDRIVMNAQGLMYAQLRGKACRNFSADIAVRIPAGNIRRPDAGIDRGAFDGDATTAGAPFLVIEVLSASTREFDLLRKLEEYKTVPSLAHIVLVDPDSPRVFHWSRPPREDWRYAVLEGLAAVITLPEIDCVLYLAALYDGLTFRSRSRLVRDDGPVA
jgi:Uma2 family endonuclease